MPFASYGSIAEVARAYQIRCARSPFVAPAEGFVGEAFRDELEFTLNEVPYEQSESFACEALIYPLLREVWKPFRDVLTLWSHIPVGFDEDLCGVPDYVLARRSPLGPMIFDPPYILLVVEAKEDDFIRGWGQCLAAMLAAQKLNPSTAPTLFGASTNGRAWEFGRLRGAEFTQDPRQFSISELDTLAGALRFVMNGCREQTARQPVAT